VDELQSAAVTRSILLDLLGFLLRLELLLLLDFLLKHLLEAFVVLGFAEHARSLLGPDVPAQVLLFLLLAEGDAVGYKFEFIFEISPTLAQLAEPDGLKLFGEEELAGE
jgi:hypothetical protein